MGKKGRGHVLNNYSIENYSKLWQKTFKEVFEEFGSWENRKGYKSWEICEL
jgi:hypothetical protein